MLRFSTMILELKKKTLEESHMKNISAIVNWNVK